MPDPNIEVLRKKTYLKTIENSVGNKLFNSLYVRFKDSGKVVDILDDGEYSCASFVSNILFLFKTIDKPHSTVKTLKEILEKDSNWRKIDIEDIEAGDVVFYEKIKFDNDSEHSHVGFILSKEEAVSTSYKIKAVARHPIINPQRKIDVVYRYQWSE